VACLSVLLAAGSTAQLYCNLVTTPGTLLCNANVLYCYKQGCGLINPEAFPFSLLQRAMPTKNSYAAG
jgi:hypothetical protein